MPAAPLYPVSAVRTIAEGLDHPEGIAFGPDGAIYAGGEAGQVYRIARQAWQDALRTGQPAAPEQIASTGGFLLGLAHDSAGNVYVCDNGRKQVVRVSPSGDVSVYSSGAPDEPFRTPNYPVFDANGRLYVADSGGWERNDGQIYRIDPGGETRVASRAPHRFPNGLALSPDGRWLYVAESTLPGVSRLPVRDDGSVGDLEELVSLPVSVPDGLAFDTAGNLYVSCYRPDLIYRVSPGGEVSVVAEDPAGTALAAPTNVAFLGPGSRWLGIASLGRWHLAALEVDAPGVPLNYPTLP